MIVRMVWIVLRVCDKNLQFRSHQHFDCYGAHHSTYQHDGEGTDEGGHPEGRELHRQHLLLE